MRPGREGENMSKHTLAYTVTKRAYLDGMAEGVGRGALGYAEDMAGEYATANAETLLDAAPDLIAALEEAERALRWAAQESKGRVKAEIVGGWLHHADAARAAIAKARGE